MNAAICCKFSVELSKQALEDLARVPEYIAVKLQAWIDEVITVGLYATRKIIGYYDEPLRGDRIGQRSIRLNKAYRAIYIEDGLNINLIKIIEVTKHEY